MIHPNTKIQHINDQIGYGVFATEFIPKGTITYVKDSLELEISQADFSKHSPEMQEQIEKYSYIDEKGNRIVSWDFAKYVNHCCDCNTMSTGYGFEIAIRDIQIGEQITDEYGMFNMTDQMFLECSRPNCRGMVGHTDLDKYYEEWDRKVQPALMAYAHVDQPLSCFLDNQTLEELQGLFLDQKNYKSVLHLKFRQLNGVTI